MALIELVRPWLDRRPAEPVLLNYLGVALFGLNEAALAVKRAAGRASISTRASRTWPGNLQAAKVRLKRPVAITLPPRERQAVNAMRGFLKDAARRARHGRRQGQHLALHDRQGRGGDAPATASPRARPASTR